MFTFKSCSERSYSDRNHERGKNMTRMVLDRPVAHETSHNDGESAHIVLLPKQLRGTTTPQAYVLTARIEGTEVQALCGRSWIPRRNPQQLPVCQQCLEIYKNDPNATDGRDELPEVA